MRKSWPNYFMDLAHIASTRSTCARRKVGAVIVNQSTRAVISTGYNGSLPGAPHCEDAGCTIEDNHCITTIHAETNAINQAARNGSPLNNAVIYCTSKPCWNCFKNIIQSGITAIYYDSDYLNSTNSHLLYLNFLKKNPHIIFDHVKKEDPNASY